MQTERKEYESIFSKIRLIFALNSVTPKEQFIHLCPCDEVLVYRAKIDLHGPYTFLYSDGILSTLLVFEHNG